MTTPGIRLLVVGTLATAGCGNPTPRAYADVATDSALKVGTPVRYQGHHVGRVQAIRPRPGGMRLALEFDSMVAPPLHASDWVNVDSGAVDHRRVEVLAGPNADAQPPLPYGGVLRQIPADSLQARYREYLEAHAATLRAIDSFVRADALRAADSLRRAKQ